MTAIQTMSPLEPASLHIEDDITHMPIGSVGIFEGPPPGPHEMAEAIARSSAVGAPRTARLSQKASTSEHFRVVAEGAGYPVVA